MAQLLRYFRHPLLTWSLTFGLGAGVGAFLYFLALYALGTPPLGNVRVLDFGIHIIAMSTACWYYRKRVGHGLLHLWEGLSICYVVNTVGAIVTGWLIYGFVTLIDPAVFAQYLENSRALLLEGKADLVKQLGAAQFAELLRSTSQTKPADLIADELSKKTLLAVLPALIISLIFRKQEYSVLNP